MTDYFKIRIDPPMNDKFESCEDCRNYADELEVCISRRCIHAVGFLRECYVPKNKAEKEQTE